jgi:hypothetical protein
MVVFMAFWFSLLMCLSGLACLSTHLNLNAVDISAFVVAPVVVALFAWGVGFVWIGRYCAREEAQFLIGFLAETLQVDRRNRAAQDPTGCEEKRI